MVLSQVLLDQIVEHCKQEYPGEACGILAGNGKTIKKIYRMTNTDKSSITFFMDPREQFAAVRDMRSSGMEMAAIYHSHPHSQAHPSERDIELAFYPDVIYIIVSLQNIFKPDLKAFWIKEGKVEEAFLKIEKGRGLSK